MGLNIPYRSRAGQTTFTPGQPRPGRYEVVETYEGRYGVAAKVRYPDANNYEGNKIIVYRGTITVEMILARTVLDPHFADDGDLSPFARFEPTDRGWRSACALADTILP